MNTVEVNGCNIESKFIIIYDDFTKPMAISLRNTISKKYSCVIWNKKMYEQNESQISNKSYLILLDEDMIKTNLANPNLKPIPFSQDVLVKQECHTIGIYIDPNTDLASISKQFKMAWITYLRQIVLPNLICPSPFSFIQQFIMIYSENQKIKFKLLFDAVNKFKMEMFEDFLHGRSLTSEQL